MVDVSRNCVRQNRRWGVVVREWGGWLLNKMEAASGKKLLRGMGDTPVQSKGHGGTMGLVAYKRLSSPKVPKKKD